MKNLNLDNWILFNAILLLIASLFTYWSQSLQGLLIISAGSFSYFIYLGHASFRSFKPYGGYPNWITFFRYLLLVVLMSYSQALPKELIFFFGLALIALDGLDGWAARTFKQASDTGALFDKEVDSFFVLCFSFLAYLYYAMPIWVLLLGTLHYLYELLVFLLRIRAIQTAPNPIGKYAAVLLFLALLAPFVLPTTIAQNIISIAAIVVLLSFGISFSLKLQIKNLTESKR